MNFYKKSQINAEELALSKIPLSALWHHKWHSHSICYFKQSCELLANDFINTCNMIETAFDYLHMGCLLVFLVEHLHFNSPL